jgi:hypothetical protein
MFIVLDSLIYMFLENSQALSLNLSYIKVEARGRFVEQRAHA